MALDAYSVDRFLSRSHETAVAGDDVDLVRRLIDAQNVALSTLRNAVAVVDDDDLAAWLAEEIADTMEDVEELNEILADLLEDKADGGVDDDTEGGDESPNRMTY